jgi:hypothetical protein
MIFRRMVMILRPKHGQDQVESGDPEGVIRAEAELEHSERRLHEAQEQVIGPLRADIYRNNIQDMIIRLLRHPPQGSGHRSANTNPH